MIVTVKVMFMFTLDLIIFTASFPMDCPELWVGFSVCLNFFLVYANCPSVGEVLPRKPQLRESVVKAMTEASTERQLSLCFHVFQELYDLSVITPDFW